MTMSTTQIAWEDLNRAANRDLENRKLGKALIARELTNKVAELMEEAKRLEEGFAALNASEEADPIDFIPIDLEARVIDYDAGDHGEAVCLHELYCDPDDEMLSLSEEEEHEWLYVLDAA